eukprot:9567351-Alexandrium_andersonii.AAC.1
MSASLVGSEMCIRDSSRAKRRCPCPLATHGSQHCIQQALARSAGPLGPCCLLYTSDAADDM